MEDPKFSAGPWHAGHLGSDSTCQCQYVVSEGYFGAIAAVHVNNGIASIADGGNDAPPREEAIANMHLIAAAPEMYAALRAVYFARGLTEDETPPTPADAMVVAALRTARGEAEVTATP